MDWFKGTNAGNKNIFHGKIHGFHGKIHGFRSIFPVDHSGFRRQVTREWSDGVAAELIRNATRDNHNPETRRRKKDMFVVSGL